MKKSSLKKNIIFIFLNFSFFTHNLMKKDMKNKTPSLEAQHTPSLEAQHPFPKGTAPLP